MNPQNKKEKERARQLRQERTKRELEYELSHDLRREQDNREMEEIEGRHRNSRVDKAILFFSTLGLGYALFFLANYVFYFFFGAAVGMLGVPISFIYPLIHGAIWVAAVVSAYRGRSVWDDIF